jgi:hypothetical protein
MLRGVQILFLPTGFSGFQTIDFYAGHPEKLVWGRQFFTEEVLQ